MKNWNKFRSKLRRIPSFYLPSDAGLTRNEWLAILSLIVILFGVAWPYFHHVSESSKRSSSAANLQQWGIALNLYLTENDNKLPETGGLPIRVEDKLAWYNSLPIYLSQTPISELAQWPPAGEPSLWVDPSLKKTKREEKRFSYGMNAWLQPDQTRSSYKIYDLEDPSRVVFLTETAGTSPRIGVQDVAFRHGKKPPHPEAKAHVLFCDGHVELVSQKELKDNPSAQDPQAPLARVTWIPFYEAKSPP